jgi:hypothetical protein
MIKSATGCSGAEDLPPASTTNFEDWRAAHYPAEDTPAEWVLRLEQASLRVEWAAEATDASGDVSLGIVNPVHIRAFEDHGLAMFVVLTEHAQGEHKAGQSSTIQRSNFRALQRDYPDTFTRIMYSDVDGLGLFLEHATREVIDVVCGLDNYPIYDESDLFALEDAEIAESFGNVYDLVLGHLDNDREREVWQDADSAVLERMWWQAVDAGRMPRPETGYEYRPHWPHQSMMDTAREIIRQIEWQAGR